MRFPLLLISLSFPLCVFGQQFRGRVYDEDNRHPLGSVLVTNKHSGALWISDSAGHIAFTAYPGDVITFSRPSYKDYDLTVFSYNDLIRVGMVKAPVQLEEVKVYSPMLRYRQDSVFNHQFFHKELGYAHSNAQMNYSGGIGADGVFSELALWATGKKKTYRNFAREMKMLEDLRYASIRYTTDLVISQTGLSDSAANAFIIKHPIPDDFVRNSNELELKMWVRNQYRASIDSSKR